MKTIQFFVFLFLCSNLVLGQGMGVNDDNSAPHSSAMLDVKASNKGALFPRLTSAQIGAIATPATGLLVFNISTNRFMYYAGSWITLPNNQDILPVGTIISHAGNTPSMITGSGQWKECDGTAVSRTTYAELYAIIDRAWGAGDGSTTFNLPDLRGQFLRGWATNIAHDPDGGTRTAVATGGNAGYNVGSKQDSKVQNHTHAFSATASSTGSDHTHRMNFDTGGGGSNANTPLTISDTNCSSCPGNGYGTTLSGEGAHTHSVSGTTSDPDLPHGGTETRPKNVYVRYYIKVSN